MSQYLEAFKLAGIQPDIAHLFAWNSAMIVIDAQESFRHRPYWNGDESPAFFDRLQALVDGAKARRIPIVRPARATLVES